LGAETKRAQGGIVCVQKLHNQQRLFLEKQFFGTARKTTGGGKVVRKQKDALRPSKGDWAIAGPNDSPSAKQKVNR